LSTAGGRTADGSDPARDRAGMDSSAQRGSPEARVVVLTGRPELAEHVLGVCAAADVEPVMLTELSRLRPLWISAALVLVGGDQADRVADLALPPRPQTYLVETGADGDLSACSVRLGAAVVGLPAGAPWLVKALVEATRPRGSTARVLAVVGGSGGSGASTLAAALAFVGARTGQSALLLDADPLGGGLDLLVGAERVGGWRWPRLAQARGHLGNLSGQLPRIDDVSLVSMPRGAVPQQAPGPEALCAVALSATRSHDLVLLDLGRTMLTGLAEVLRLSQLAILLVSADVRGVAAGRETLRWLEGQSDRWALVLRRPRVGGLGSADAAAGFEIPLLGSMADDPAIALAAERGEPPARASRSQLSRLCGEILAAQTFSRRAAA
jgi:secretion/DNA translocation related CpaE-like protein